MCVFRAHNRWTYRKSVAGGGLEDLADTLARLGRALDVAGGANLLSDGETLGARDGALVHAGQVGNGLLVVAEILLARNEDDGEALAEVQHLGNPLFLDVVERVGRVHGETDEDDVRVRVRKGTETVIVLLAGGIPKGQLDLLAIDLDVGNVVLKDGRDVDLCGSCVSVTRAESSCAHGPRVTCPAILAVHAPRGTCPWRRR